MKTGLAQSQCRRRRKGWCENRDVLTLRSLAQRRGNGPAGQDSRFQRQKHDPPGWQCAQLPESINQLVRAFTEPRRSADRGRKCRALDTIDAQVILGQIHILTPDERAFGTKPLVAHGTDMA